MNFLENVLNLIFSPNCGICGKSGCYICNECIEKIKKLKLAVNRIDKYNDEEKYFDKHLYIFKYEDIIRKKIIEYKFGNKPYLFNMFCEFFVKNKKACRFLKSYDIIVSVPISKKRFKERRI